MYQDDFYMDSYVQAKRDYFARTYRIMALGLAVTFLTAMGTALFIPWIAYNSLLVILLCAAELFLVIGFSRRIMTASYGQVIGMFFAYACLSGVTLSSIFLVFDISTIFLCFLSTAVAFGAMALFGVRTARDLSPWRSTLFGGLVGIIVMSLLGLFLRIPAFDLFISVFGVLLFMGMTAYDSQKLGQMFDQAGGTEIAQRYAVYAALQLYLDFINLFVHLLSILSLSNRRD